MTSLSRTRLLLVLLGAALGLGAIGAAETGHEIAALVLCLGVVAAGAADRPR